MKKILLATVLTLSALSALAQDLSCSFVSTKTLKATGKEIPGEGTVTFAAPDRLTMTYTVPEGDYLIIEGDELRSCAGGKTITANTTKNASMRTLRNTLLNCITGSYVKAAWENDADVVVEENGGIKTVTLTARKQAARGYSRIVIDYNADSLPVRMVLDEFGGISTAFEFKY